MIRTSAFSARRSARPRLLDHVRGGDLIVVHRLDRLARGCARIYEDKVSGASRNRPALTRSAARRETVSRWVEGRIFRQHRRRCVIIVTVKPRPCFSSDSLSPIHWARFVGPARDHFAVAAAAFPGLARTLLPLLLGTSALLGHRYPTSWTKHERARLARSPLCL